MYYGICGNLARLKLPLQYLILNNKVYKASRIASIIIVDTANSTMFVKLAELLHPLTLKLDASNLSMFVKLAELSVTLKLD